MAETMSPINSIDRLSVNSCKLLN